MTGHVDHYGRALIEVDLKPTPSSPITSITAWIDTGFTGDLVLPQRVIDKLSLVLSGNVDAILADGSKVEMQAYECDVQWFSNLRRLEIVANEGACPLLGVGLLRNLDLRINYRSRTLMLD